MAERLLPGLTFQVVHVHVYEQLADLNNHLDFDHKEHGECYS